MKITCPMCDGNSVPCQETEIALDCDWCGGRGWIDESENRFYANEESDAEDKQESLVWCSKRVSTSSVS